MTKSVLIDGRYTIINVGSKNAAQLATTNEKQKVQATALEKTPRFYWQVTKLANGNYWLKNASASNYAYVDDDATIGTKVVGSSSKREWVINGTGVTNVFTIAPSFARSHYWGVEDADSGAIVKLESGKGDDSNNWEIKAAY